MADCLNCGVFLIELLALNYLWITYDDATRIKVIVQCLALTQKLRRKKQVEVFTFQLRFE